MQCGYSGLLVTRICEDYFFLGGGGGRQRLTRGGLWGLIIFVRLICMGGKVLIKAFKGLYPNKNGLFRVVFPTVETFLGSSFDWLKALF